MVTAGIVAVGSIVLGGSAPAAAVAQVDSSGQITAPADGQVVSSPSVTVSARTGLMQLRMGLYVEGPSTPMQKVAEGGANQTISGTFDAGNAPNGTFTVTLKGEITGTRYASTTFKLRRPAETPGNVNASLQGATKVLMTWSKGAEPDLQSYEVSNTQSGIVGRLPVDSACDASSCKATLTVPPKAAGQKVGFTVKAFRGDGDGGSIGSGESGAAYVAVPTPPTAQPKKEAPKTRGTPKESKRVDPLPTLPAKKQTQPTSKPTTRRPGVSKLPAIPDTDSDGNLPIPTADDRGETDGLTPEGAKNGADTTPVQAGGVKAQSDESPIANIGQYGLYIAGGLLLLLLGAHAGAWARRRALATEGGRHPQAPAGTGAAVAAVPLAAGGPEGAVPVAGAARGDDDGVLPPATPPRRRPAVILAVAKTRIPDQSRVAESSSVDRSADHAMSSAGGRSGGQERSSRDHWSGEGRERPSPDRSGGGEESVVAEHPGNRGLSSVDGAESQERGRTDDPVVQRVAARADDPVVRGVPSAGRVGAQESPTVGASGVHTASSGDRPGVHKASSGDRPGAYGASSGDRLRVHGASSGGRPGVQEPIGADSGRAQGTSPADGSRVQGLPRTVLVDHARKDLPGPVLPLGGGEARAAAGEAGEAGSVKEGHVVRHEPVRIALPSSAVTDVAEPSTLVPRAVIRIEDRWDDYLPPSPRSMEDSGFWERPQPGAADFWAADDDDADGRGDDEDKRAYAVRRNKGTHS
ncbi:hypothetical protein [Nonomuraea sp. SYSU D8015]|uniref:hypothetical protein n=1 Tax=Nonomuraea sp. SYSU D8015 TaxID=2593644 RepID=UPI00166167D7|nr:hypothetical protein [Nonomuraea sp. SYSU D8015]